MTTRPRSGGRAAAGILAIVVVGLLALGGPSAGAHGLSGQPAQISNPITTRVTTPPRSATTAKPTPTTARPTATTHPPAPAPRPATPYVPAPYTSPTRYVAPTVPATTVAATTTTIAPIGGRLPAAPATVPLRTTGTNGHVDPVFAWLSGIGFLLGLAILAGRLIVTRTGGRDRAPLEPRA